MSNASGYRIRQCLDLTQNEGKALQFTIWTDETHTTAKNISNTSITFTFKMARKNSDTAILTKSSTNILQIEKTDATNGIISVKIAQTDTATLVPASYRFELYLKDTSTTPTTYALVSYGDITVRSGIN